MPLTRRHFLRSTAGAASAALLPARQTRRPNVILVMTDDQGYGDVSLHGNPHLKTPNMDRIGREGVQFTQFQVCPVCSPTRASLMTGRYYYRTGIVNTFLGRSLMYPDEVTLAEILRGAGYRTGIFGKWHLGDNHPMRAMDQGFEEALLHKGGGIGQPSDPPGNSYFNPVLQRNGKEEKHSGYCTDIFFREAMKWMEAGGSRPFFAYVATNAPHGPLIVGEEWSERFLKLGLDGNIAKVYGMVANIDHNLGLLMEKLRALGIERDTILIFLTDNGPIDKGPSDAAAVRYNAGLRGTKATVYEGGIRVPCFLRWPARLQPRKSDRIAAAIDLLPTILEACGVARPAGVKLDGRSLMPLAEGRAQSWPDRMLFVQYHRADRPEIFRDCAVRTQRYKLVNGKDLYDLESDPAEQRNVAAANPETVSRLRQAYIEWFEDVSSVRRYIPPRIHIGTTHENPVVLTRQDWRIPPDAGPRPAGWWEVDVRQAGKYEVKMQFDPAGADAEVLFVLGGAVKSMRVAKGATEATFEWLELAAGPAELRGLVVTGEKTEGAKYVHVKRL